jgi:chemotaxis protein methyltransferase CheR
MNCAATQEMMQTTISNPLLSRLAELLAERMGLYFPASRQADLARAISAAATALGMENAEMCALELLSAPLTQKRIDILARHLTVGETYFFREKRGLDALEEHVFPELMRICVTDHRPFRIWSAGCCTGEEPYTIAMLLDRMIPHDGQWNAIILASDINRNFLRKAAEGIYGEWSFRDTPGWARKRYFKRRKDGRFDLLPRIRDRVTFSYLNLAEEVYPSSANGTSGLDVIICRNVLMYFSSDGAKKMIESFHQALAPGGWLIVSPVDCPGTNFSQFTAVRHSEATLYRKTSDSGLHVKAGVFPGSVPTVAPGAPRVAEAKMLAPSDFGEPLLPSIDNRNAREKPAAAPDGPGPRPRFGGLAENTPASIDQRDTFFRAARACAGEGKLSEAIQWCEKGIAANKLDPAIHYLLATIYQEQGLGSAAMNSLADTLYLDPDFVAAHFALGTLCLSQQRHEEAQRHFKNAIALLRQLPSGQVVPESGGMTAGYLMQTIAALQSRLPDDRGTAQDNTQGDIEAGGSGEQ